MIFKCIENKFEKILKCFNNKKSFNKLVINVLISEAKFATPSSIKDFWELFLALFFLLLSIIKKKQYNYNVYIINFNNNIQLICNVMKK